MKKNILFVAALIVVQSAIFLGVYWLTGREFLAEAIRSLLDRLIASIFATVLSGLILYPVLKEVFAIKRQSLKTGKMLIFALFVASVVSSCTSTKESYAAVNGKLTNLQRNRAMNYVAVEKAQRIELTEAKYAELDLKRLESQPVKADLVKGYEGKILNLTRWQNIQFNISRIEDSGVRGRPVISETLAPGQQVMRFLLPGQYSVLVFINGQLRDEKIFLVGAEIKAIFGEQLHWYVYRDER